MIGQQASANPITLDVEADKPSRIGYIIGHLVAVLCGGLPSFIAFNAWTYPIPLIIVFAPILMLVRPSIRAESIQIETCFRSVAITFFPGATLTGILWFIYSMGSADWR